VVNDISGEQAALRAEESPQDWFFTFGADHTHPDTGQRLGRNFVVIHGTCDSTRDRMMAAFGNRWSHQYPSAEKAGVEKYGLDWVSMPEPHDAGDADQPFSPLVGAIFTQMATDSANTTNWLIDSYKRQLREALAELWAIRTGITGLLNEPWAPSARSVHNAVLFPADELLAAGRRMAEQEVP
jgi:hypothetical protein